MTVYLVVDYDHVLAVFSTFYDASEFLMKNQPKSSNIWINSMIVDSELNK